MEDEFDIEELEIVLGLKNKKEELNKIISEPKNLSFLGAISKILNNSNSNDLYEKTQPEIEQNEMLANFCQNVGLDKVANVKINNYENSDFAFSIKGEDTISHTPNIHFSKEYVQKLKKDFVEKVEEEMKPIEIKQNNYEYNNKNYKNNYKKNTKYGKNENKKININNEEQNDNKIEDKKESEKIEDEKKEVEKKEENKEIIENEEKNEEKEENNEGNNQENNNNGNSYKRNYKSNYNNYNKRNKYNKNKGHKAYRDNYNARRQNK